MIFFRNSLRLITLLYIPSNKIEPSIQRKNSPHLFFIQLKLLLLTKMIRRRNRTIMRAFLKLILLSSISLLSSVFTNNLNCDSNSNNNNNNNNNDGRTFCGGLLPIVVVPAVAMTTNQNKPLYHGRLFAYRGGEIFGSNNNNDDNSQEEDEADGKEENEKGDVIDDDDSDDDKEEEVEVVVEDQSIADGENITMKEENVTTSKSTKAMSLSAPFKMNSVVLEEASNAVEEEDEEEEEDLSTTVNDEKKEEEVDDDDETNKPKESSQKSMLVGGATNVKERPSSKQLGPIDTSRSSPSSSRLIRQEEGAETAENENEESAEEEIVTTESSWWTNVFSQQSENAEEDLNEGLEEEEETTTTDEDESVDDKSSISTTDNEGEEEATTEVGTNTGEDEKRRRRRRGLFGIFGRGDNETARRREEQEEEDDDESSDAVEDRRGSRQMKEDGRIKPGASNTIDVVPVKRQDTSKDDGVSRKKKKRKSKRKSIAIEEITTSSSSITTSTTREAVVVSEVEDESDARNYVRSYVSTGLWVPIDCLLTAGLSSQFPSLRASRKLRSVRKYTAQLTGIHGLLSGKPHEKAATANAYSDVGISTMRKPIKPTKETTTDKEADTETEEEEERIKLAAEELRRQELEAQRKVMFENARKMERVREIDRLISEGQQRLQQLICEKDVLQQRPNPLFNYTSEEISDDNDNNNKKGKNRDDKKNSNNDEKSLIHASRTFKFPPDELVEEYLDMMFWTRRIIKMNHSDLWQDDSSEDEEDETLGDDLFTPSADAHILYQRGGTTDVKNGRNNNEKRRRTKNGGGGSWLLRQSLGKGPSLGEKIGEAAETAAYKAVCGAVMSFLARSLSGLHGINVMKHSDIRLVLEQAPDLPPVGEGVIPGGSADYAQETIKRLMKKKARKLKRRSKRRASDDSFVQRDAVTELLLSHVQISAPLLKLFPLAWQRALLGNILTLSTSLITDFFDGVEFQILGHRLSFSFQPITEVDLINHMTLAGGGFNNRRARPEEFEAAVAQTADDLSDELKFLDKWHERALGSGVLRSQIANLIARIVLTLTDEVLSGARMDLFCAQAGGPRLVSGLEYRVKTDY